jgi:hypothetical protein
MPQAFIGPGGAIMLALSIRQPWAWMIMHGGKDVENRDWHTKVRGRVLIHASKGMTKDEWDSAWHFSRETDAPSIALFSGLTYDNIERGGIIGSVVIYDCVTEFSSPWFVGTYGFLLRDSRPLPFTPWRGQLGFFNVPVAELPAQTRQALLGAQP